MKYHIVPLFICIFSACLLNPSVAAAQQKKTVKEVNISQLDKAMAAKVAKRSGMDWYTVDTKNMKLDGLHWRKAGEPFRRIPLNASVSKGVDYLAWNTAGVMLRFKTNAKEIRIDAKLHHIHRMYHMTPLGSMGFDLYQGSGTSKFYRKSASFSPNKNEYIATVFGPVKTEKIREFTLHFPLYAGVKSLEIGVTKGAKIELPTPWEDDRPIVVYGTSIQQGGCASRPGMCHTNQLSRMLNRPFINLAFSGSGKGEPAMAKILADVKDPALYILDYDANAGVAGLKRTLSNVIDIIRAKHPETPILLVSKLEYGYEFDENNAYPEIRWQFQNIHMAEIRKRRDAGDKNIHFLDGTTLYGSDPSECTVDGIHATDLGFYMISKRMAPVIRRILSLEKLNGR